MNRNNATSEVRNRIVETADRLFYQDGIRKVGIDRIIADAGVAKASLYKHFKSKDDLILASLQMREQKMMQYFKDSITRNKKNRKTGLQSFFVALKDLFESPEFRGCPFQNAAVELADAEHAATDFVRKHKQRLFAMLNELVEEALGKKNSKLVPVIALLVEGACISAIVHNSSESADIARKGAQNLIQQAK